MRRFKGPVRKLAILSARLILTILRFMTDRQRMFNILTTRSLDQLTGGIDHATSILVDQVRALQELSKRQEERIATLEAALNSRAEPLHPKQGDQPTRPEV